MVLPAGTTLQGGQYRIERVLGQGGFGITYLASGQGGSAGPTRVAIKEFFPVGAARSGTDVVPHSLSPGDYQSMERRFHDEGKRLGAVRHPGVVRMLGLFEENSTTYLVMEHLEGTSLLTLLAGRGGHVSEGEAVDYISGVAEALQAVHAVGLLHRDIAPDNIVVTQAGRCVVVDFGAAREFAANASHLMTKVLKEGYAPLEQYGEKGRFGPPLDVYGLAATLYHLLTGQRPVSAPDRAVGVVLASPRDVRSSISEPLSSFVMRAMAVKAADRPQTMKAFLAQLQAAQRSGAKAPVSTRVAPTQPVAALSWPQAQSTTVAHPPGVAGQPTTVRHPPGVAVQPTTRPRAGAALLRVAACALVGAAVMGAARWSISALGVEGVVPILSSDAGNVWPAAFGREAALLWREMLGGVLTVGVVVLGWMLASAAAKRGSHP